jgi:hypothetical protein
MKHNVFAFVFCTAVCFNCIITQLAMLRHYCCVAMSLMLTANNEYRGIFSAVKVVAIVSLGLFSVLNISMSMETIRTTCTWFKTRNNLPIPSWPLNLSDAVVQEMLQHKLERSAHLQSKFLARQNALISTFPAAMRFDVYVGNSSAIAVNGTKWAYLHVWYVLLACNQPFIPSDEILKH